MRATRAPVAGPACPSQGGQMATWGGTSHSPHRWEFSHVAPRGPVTFRDSNLPFQKQCLQLFLESKEDPSSLGRCRGCEAQNEAPSWLAWEARLATLQLGRKGKI